MPSEEVASRLTGRGLKIAIGPFDVSLRSRLPQVIRGVTHMYADFPISPPGEFIDFHINLFSPSLLRRWFRPQVNFAFADTLPFKPLPMAQGFAMFEWGLNWVVANHGHQYAIVHAAAVEKDGRGFIFPGAPGSGKSTLCAALVSRGWRLLSDEMAMISLADGLIWPIPRPVSLKNASIEIIRKLSVDVVMGEVVADTAKGNVAHMRPPKASVVSAKVPAPPFAIVFPTYRAAAATEYAEISKGHTLMLLAENCFNYPVLGAAGFNCLADAVDRSHCRTLTYSDMNDAISALER